MGPLGAEDAGEPVRIARDERIGVTFRSVRTLRPSGTERTISSARTVVASRSICVRGGPSNAISRPEDLQAPP